MKIGAVVQARMTSDRFPGKVLHELNGKPALKYLLERLTRCRNLDGIVIATSQEEPDNAIADFCRQNKMECYRGPLSNVAGRFKETIDKYGFDAFVRINADSPLIDQEWIDRAVEVFRRGDFEIVTNVLKRTFPRGESFEIVESGTFRRGFQFMQDPEDLEHVTRFFYKNPKDFRIFNILLERDLSGIRLCFDTTRDMDVICAILKKMKRPHWQYGLNDVVALYQEWENN